MPRILAIDYGTKRTGLAVTDELQLIATPLTTVDTPRLITFLDDYLRREKVERFVVGEARRMSGEPSQSAQYIEPFVVKLQQHFPGVPVDRVDERFTSKIAFQSMIDGGLSRKQRQNKALIDTLSATIILQSWMQTQENIKQRK